MILLITILIATWISVIKAIRLLSSKLKKEKAFRIFLSSTFIIVGVIISLLLGYLYAVFSVPLYTHDDINNNKEASEFLTKNYDNSTFIASYQVKNFNIYENTFMMTNYQGHCKGYALLEKSIFLNDAFKVKSISNNSINLDGISKNLASYPYDDSKLPKYQKNDVKKIMEAIIYVYKNPTKFYKATAIQYQFLNVKEVSDYYTTLIMSKFDPDIKKNNYDFRLKLNIESLINRLHNNEPIVIAMGKEIGGHAVLAYKYEKVSDTEYKLYVADSNYPFLKNDIDEHYETNLYVVFKKINNKWQYKYDPYINGNYVYKHKYDSYQADGTLFIF